MRNNCIKLSITSIMEKFDQSGILHSVGGCVFFTAGNSFRSDDGVGPYIGGKLAVHMESQTPIYIINTETTPEDYIDYIIKLSPGSVVFIDAAQFNGKPGEVILMDEKAEFPDYSLSTHTLPLSLIAALIKAECNTAIYYIGIQAGSFDFGEKLSDPVKKAADMLIAGIKSRIFTVNFYDEKDMK